MPPKITSKNLSYDDSAPPFLAALRAQAAGASGPNPLAAAQRRSAKKRSSSEDAEDVPLIVDEDGNVVKDLEVDKDGVVVKDLTNHGDGPDGSKDASATKESDANKASIGGRKRKVGKVIGDSADQPDDKAAAKTKGANDSGDKEGPKDRKPKKKPKKIKLSFDEDEG